MTKFQKVISFSYNLAKNPRKVEKILKGSLDLISPPSLSVKIQIMAGKLA